MENTSVDKPSLHWSDKYYLKVSKMIDKNDKFNFSGKNSVFKNIPTYYFVNWKDFLPIFIGWFHSLFSTCRTYGIIRSSSVFYTPLYKYFRSRLLISMVAHFFTGPFLLICILFFGPIIFIPYNEYYASWGKAVSTFVSSTGGPASGMKVFADEIVVKFFNTNAWWMTLILLIVVPSFNISTFISVACFNKHNNKWIKLVILENEMKMKLSNFERKKKGK